MALIEDEKQVEICQVPYSLRTFLEVSLCSSSHSFLYLLLIKDILRHFSSKGLGPSSPLYYSSYLCSISHDMVVQRHSGREVPIN